MNGETDADKRGLEAALRWLVRVNDDPSPEVVAGLRAWRAEAPQNQAAWKEATMLWDLAGAALAALDETQSTLSGYPSRGEDPQ
ncbi:DUF4880 domain-containing protein [Caulobacter segnis]|uniref:FecR/PupR family sigma factor regulator n=1 Tax=Caulobacter segnis TaxID=88688 RepID=UPI00240EC551|nr:DUF4880 domain-containing protein [Caulobacter segnis]MDG2522935.1 DUF4880 domain-containing protein [Caulobacter segnis]